VLLFLCYRAWGFSLPKAHLTRPLRPPSKDDPAWPRGKRPWTLLLCRPFNPSEHPYDPKLHFAGGGSSGPVAEAGPPTSASAPAVPSASIRAAAFSRRLGLGPFGGGSGAVRGDAHDAAVAARRAAVLSGDVGRWPLEVGRLQNPPSSCSRCCPHSLARAESKPHRGA